MKDSKVAIIGAGPAGSSAAIYLKRYGMEPTLFEKELVGGKVNFTESIVNYLGYTKVKGPLLGTEIDSQLQEFNIPIIYKEVKGLRKEENGSFVVSYGDNEERFSYVILACGLKEKDFHVKGEEVFKRRGFSSCAICDGAFYKGKDIAVIGAGTAAFEEASYLATIASHVYLIARRNEFRSQITAVNKFKSFPNTTIYAPYNAIEANGKMTLESLVIQNSLDKSTLELKVSGLFAFIGQEPTINFIKDLDIFSSNGIVLTDSRLETKVKGLYAAGDCRDTMLRQVATASSDGAIAAFNIHNDYLNN